MPDASSRGRRYPEEPHPYRAMFQRDRERVVHCTAFRRLVGKTQVLVGTINDHHRTRLTHTLEVAQVARTIARRLRLNEDLTEAVALSHDLGHPPFGHAGETELDNLLAKHGGFDHNLYGLRRVDELEERYPEFPGLNLSAEVREAFVQHAKRKDYPGAAELLEPGGPLLEAQLADAADNLAYDTHDIDDALGIGVITLDDLEGVPMWRRVAEPIRARYPSLRGDSFKLAVIRELIAWQVSDIVAETERVLSAERIDSVEAVRRSAPLVRFSPEMVALRDGLESFLMRQVYQDHRVLRLASRGKRILRDLFHALVASPMLLPPRHLQRWQGAPQHLLTTDDAYRRRRVGACASVERVVADYLAGMTDRYAQEEATRLFHPADGR